MFNTLENIKPKNRNPSVLVVCKVSLKRGVEHGILIDCTHSYATMKKKINNMLTTSPTVNSGEYMISKTFNYGDMIFSEYEQMKDIFLLTKLYMKYGEVFAKFFKEYSRLNTKDIIDIFESHYKGCWEDVGEYFTSKFSMYFGYEYLGISIMDYLKIEDLEQKLNESLYFTKIKDSENKLHFVDGI